MSTYPANGSEPQYYLAILRDAPLRVLIPIYYEKLVSQIMRKLVLSKLGKKLTPLALAERGCKISNFLQSSDCDLWLHIVFEGLIPTFN